MENMPLFFSLFSKHQIANMLNTEILITDVKLMLGKVLKVSHRYLPPFLSYREQPAGGGEFRPHSGARVKQERPN